MHWCALSEKAWNWMTACPIVPLVCQHCGFPCTRLEELSEEDWNAPITPLITTFMWTDWHYTPPRLSRLNDSRNGWSPKYKIYIYKYRAPLNTYVPSLYFVLYWTPLICELLNYFLVCVDWFIWITVCNWNQWWLHYLQYHLNL